MKKIFYTLIGVIVFTFFFYFLDEKIYITQSIGENFSSNETTYIFDSTIYEEKMLVTDLKIFYKNNSEDTLYDLKLLLPANIFYQESYISLLDVKANLPKFYYKKTKEDLTFYFEKGLLPGEKIELSLKYTTFIPEQNKRFGSSGNTYFVSNWYPVVAPYDSEKKTWQVFIKDKVGKGDPYFYEVAYFKGTLKAPLNYDLASPFVVDEKKTSKNKIFKINSKLPVRDFTFVCGTNINKKSKIHNDIEVEYYYRKKNRGILDKAISQLDFYNKILGKYPLKKLVIVDVPLEDFYGMEFSGIIFLSDKLKHNLESTLAHEIAHQYWYGLVGTNQIEEPWIDEGLASYTALLYFEEKYGTDYYNERINFLKKKNIIYSSLLPLKEYPTKNIYKDAVYNKPQLFWDAVRSLEGREKLFLFLAKLQEEYKYKILKGDAVFKNLKLEYNLTEEDFQKIISILK